jgi:hypothetical protein
MIEASSDRQPLYDEVTDEILAALRAGREPDLAELARRYPALADRLAGHAAQLRDLVQIDRAAAAARDAAGAEGVPRQLDDFVLGRELGRGGMGVVYEAEQLALRRRVALKVLPRAALLEPRRLQRFLNEAQAAARLHHRHIVPVYAVGSAHGLHYYAMQLVEGSAPPS